jgi:hypothetical protein
MLKPKALAWLARQLVGINANGNSEIVNKMRRAVDGVSAGEPWCACFVQYCAREVDDLMRELDLQPDATFLHNLPATESTQALWHKSMAATHALEPSVGAIVVWRSQSHPEFGHCGIVVRVEDGAIITVEGNTSMPGASAGSTESERNGRGVWKKTRLAGSIPGFDRLGYILPWG